MLPPDQMPISIRRKHMSFPITRRHFALLSLGTGLSLLPQSSRAASATPVSGDVSAQLEAVVRSYLEIDRFRGAVLVSYKGETLLRHGWGVANEITGAENTPETAYQIASLTKAFTAMSCVQLDEAGRLSLDDPITRYLPEVIHSEKDGVAITIRHLLSHTSGIPDFLGFYDVNNPFSYPRTFDQLFLDILEHDLDFTPGTEFFYGNSDYIYAGLIIERVSGLTYENYLKQHIFAPVGMNSSFVVEPPDPAPPIAKGYGVVTGQLVATSDFGRVDLVWSAGGITSTVDDLLRWHEALLGAKLASRAAIDAMYVPVLENYGLGWETQTIAGHRAIEHEGHTIGYDAKLARFLEDDLLIILLSNLQDAPVAEIAEGLAEVVFGQR